MKVATRGRRPPYLDGAAGIDSTDGDSGAFDVDTQAHPVTDAEGRGGQPGQLGPIGVAASVVVEPDGTVGPQAHPVTITRAQPVLVIGIIGPPEGHGEFAVTGGRAGVPACVQGDGVSLVRQCTELTERDEVLVRRPRPAPARRPR